VTKLDLMNLTAAALHERAAYILDNADSIPVRVKVDGRWQDLYLTELPSHLAVREAFRLLLRAPVPVRVLPPDPDNIDKRSTEPMSAADATKRAADLFASGQRIVRGEEEA
jgi:hypothetical protein